ncbi:hypothetical protein SSX86_005898 [Deinandra increscens subsp. villosa]|uniref:Stigma-specific Stig1 family protein n=1 Tax=Deinandra increscens subsp. villosa TaxID=3103831 RepID=A0AAP0DM24_9ASTR
MKIMQIIFMISITITIAVMTITTLTVISTTAPPSPTSVTKPFPARRPSRFLAEKERNPRAADHCHKDDEICYVLEAGKNTTCCNNKCMDLSEDKHNCGACKKKCKFTNACCRGECVNVAYDKRHCGSCGNKCMPGGYCIYGLCNYA